MNFPKLPLAILVMLVLSFGAAPAEAHASKNSSDGKIRITWGWIDEPAVTKAPNRLDLIVRDAATGAGICDESASLNVALHFADKEHDVGQVTTQRGEGPGNFTSERPITPSEPGVYVLHVRGTIKGSEIDLEIPANHAVQAVEETYFPEKGEAPPSQDETSPHEDGEATMGNLPCAAAAGPGGETSALEARVATLEQKVAALEADAKVQATAPGPVTVQTPSPPPPGTPAPTPFLGLGIVAMAAVVVALALRRVE